MIKHMNIMYIYIHLHIYIYIYIHTHQQWSLILQAFPPGKKGVASNVSGGIQWVDPFGCRSGRTPSAGRWRCPLGMDGAFSDILLAVFSLGKSTTFMWIFSRQASSCKCGWWRVWSFVEVVFWSMWSRWPPFINGHVGFSNWVVQPQATA